MTAVSLLHDDLSTRHMPIAGLNSRTCLPEKTPKLHVHHGLYNTIFSSI
jgi:hypothetical protein